MGMGFLLHWSDKSTLHNAVVSEMANLQVKLVFDLQEYLFEK